MEGGKKSFRSVVLLAEYSRFGFRQNMAVIECLKGGPELLAYRLAKPALRHRD